MVWKKGELSRDTSPMYKQQLSASRDRQQAKARKNLLDANARWNETRRDGAKNDIRRIVVLADQSNPELRKKMIYLCMKGFN